MTRSSDDLRPPRHARHRQGAARGLSTRLDWAVVDDTVPYRKGGVKVDISGRLTHLPGPRAFPEGVK